MGLYEDAEGSRHWRSRAEPMPELRTALSVDLVLADAEYARIQVDGLPEEMEDKWLFLWNDPWLDLHRSWTGYHVYRIRFDRDADGWRAVEAWVNRDPEQYTEEDDARDAQLLTWLVRVVRLEQEMPFPGLDDDASDEDVIRGLSFGGTGFTGIPVSIGAVSLHAADVVFLHGRESGPTGSKIRSIREAGWNVAAPDCQGVEDVAERVARGRQALEDATRRVVLVGSSMGGLTAALLWSQIADTPLADKVVGVLLLAPALNWEQAAAIERVHPNTLIMHGREDELVPCEASRAFAARFDCPLVELDDGHRLADSHELILMQLEHLAT